MEVVRVDPLNFLNEDCLNALCSYLDTESVKAASLVSRNWSNIFLSNLWRRARLRVDLVTYPNQAQDLLQSVVIRLIPEIRIWRADTSFLELLLQFIRDDDTMRLKELSIPKEVLSFYLGRFEVAPDIVAGAAMKLETFKANFSDRQVKAILTTLATNQDSRLRNLRIRNPLNPINVDISAMPLDFVIHALIKLESIEFEFGLSADQLAALFARICHSPDLRIRRLKLCHQDLTNIPIEVLTGVIQRLEVVMFSYGRMELEQINTILTMRKEGRLGRLEKTTRISYITGDRGTRVNISIVRALP